MKTNNKRWGYLKIKGELKKPKIKVGLTSIARILKQNGFEPTDRKFDRTWFNFLHSHGEGYSRYTIIC